MRVINNLLKYGGVACVCVCSVAVKFTFNSLSEENLIVEDMSVCN